MGVPLSYGMKCIVTGKDYGVVTFSEWMVHPQRDHTEITSLKKIKEKRYDCNK